MSNRMSLVVFAFLAMATPSVSAQDQPNVGSVRFHTADTVFPCREKTPEDFAKRNLGVKVIVTTVRIAATFEVDEDQVDRIDYWLRMPRTMKIADYMPNTRIGAEDAEVVRGNQSVSNEATVTSLNGEAGVGFRLWAVDVASKGEAGRKDENSNQIASNVTVKSLPRKALVLAASTEDAGRTLHFRFKRHSQFTLQGDKDYVLLAKVPKDWTGDNFILECVAYHEGEASERKIVNIGLYIEGDDTARRRVEKIAESRVEETTKVDKPGGLRPSEKPRPKKSDIALSGVLLAGKWSWKIPMQKSSDTVVLIPRRDGTLDCEFTDQQTNKTITIPGKEAKGGWSVKDSILTLSALNYEFIIKVNKFDDSQIAGSLESVRLNNDDKQKFNVGDDLVVDTKLNRVK